MRSSIKRLVFLLGAVSLANSPALAQTATFDDLPSNTPVPAGYALPGSIWSNWYTVSRSDVYPAGKDACVISEANCAWNNGGQPAAISRATPFDFTGGYFMAWADAGCAAYFSCTTMTLTVSGFNGATLIGSNTVTLDPWTQQWFGFNFANVDNVTFNTQLYNGGEAAWFLADNLEFNQNTVPEPASMALLGTGLVGLYGVVRRRRPQML